MAGTFLLFGGTGGIGSAIVRILQGRGDECFVVGRDPKRDESLLALPGVDFITGDITEAGCCEAVMERVGPELDGLVYAVGSINLGSLRRLGPDDFRRDFELNAMGAALAVKAALPALKKGEGTGSILLFSSVAAIHGFPLHASVGMAKGAVSGLTLALAAELAPHVRVNAIAPSLTATPMSEPLLAKPQVAEAIAAQHPLRRLGRPEDIARLAVYLLSPEADWVTGQIIAVDGGRSSLQPGR